AYTRAVIPHPRGWSRTYSGDALTLTHPDGLAAGGIRYRERVRPLVPARAVVEEQLARTPRCKNPLPGTLQMTVTREGDDGAHIPSAGTFDGRPACRALGRVFGADFSALLSGMCAVPERVAEFPRQSRHLLRADAHALGVRRRRYLYTPPPGWN